MATIVTQQNPMDRYFLTESTNSVLNGVIAYCMRETRSEKHKPTPNTGKIAELDKLRKEARALQNNNESYESLERMEEIVAKYSPILSSDKKKLQQED